MLRQQQAPFVEYKDARKHVVRAQKAARLLKFWPLLNRTSERLNTRLSVQAPDARPRDHFKHVSANDFPLTVDPMAVGIDMGYRLRCRLCVAGRAAE